MPNVLVRDVPEDVHAALARPAQARRQMRRAYELRANVTASDAAYVALAETLDCGLWTGDRRLGNAVGPVCVIRVLS